MSSNLHPDTSGQQGNENRVYQAGTAPDYHINLSEQQDMYPDPKVRDHYSIFLVPLQHKWTWRDLRNKKKLEKFTAWLKQCGWQWHPYLTADTEGFAPTDKKRFAPTEIITPEVATIHFGNRIRADSRDTTLSADTIMEKISLDKGEYVHEPLFFTLDPDLYYGRWTIIEDKNVFQINLSWVDLLLLKDGLGILSFKTELHQLNSNQEIDLTALGSLHRALRDYSNDTIYAIYYGRESGKTEEALYGEQTKFWSEKVCKEWLGNGRLLGHDDDEWRIRGKIFLQSQRYAKILSFVQTNIDEKQEFLWNRPVADPAVYYKDGYKQAVTDGKWSVTSLGAQNAIIAGYPTVRDLFLFELGTVSNQHASMGWPEGAGRGWQYSVEYIRNILENNLVEVWEYWSGLALRDTFSFVSYDESMPISWQAETRYYPLYLITIHLRMRLEKFSREIIDSDLAGYCKGKQIRADLVEFRNHYWFQEVTKDFVGVEVFDRMKKGMNIEELFAQVTEEIAEVSEHLQQKFEKGVKWVLIFLLIFFAPIKNLWEKFIIPPIENALTAHWLIFLVIALLASSGFLCLLIMHQKFQIDWIRDLGNRANRFFSNLQPCRLLVESSATQIPDKITLTYDFIGQGAVMRPEPGRVYIDVGNSLEPGIIDHHQPGAPGKCAAALVLDHPGYVRSQVDTEKNQLTIIVHHQPDMDAVSGAFFARYLAHTHTHKRRQLPAELRKWAEYVCAVDRGETRLNPNKPLTLYSLFMMRQHRVHQECRDRSDIDRQLLKKGFAFILTVLEQLQKGCSCDKTGWLKTVKDFAAERKMVQEDLDRYRRDLERAQIVAVTLPRKDGKGREEVAGVWLDRPDSILFKAWARGDKAAAPPHGFIFTAIQLSPTRHIFSVDPDSPVWLKGLGDLLEEAESAKRQRTGQERTGNNRPGYSSPDPWYDGRSPLHNYTIVDAPREGTVLTADEVRDVFGRFENL